MSWKHGHIPFIEDLQLKEWYSMSDIGKLFKIPNFGAKKLLIFLRNINILNSYNEVVDEIHLDKYFKMRQHEKSGNYVTQANKAGVIFIWNLLQEQKISDGKAIKEIKREPPIPKNVFI